VCPCGNLEEDAFDAQLADKRNRVTTMKTGLSSGDREEGDLAEAAPSTEREARLLEEVIRLRRSLERHEAKPNPSNEASPASGKQRYRFAQSGYEAPEQRRGEEVKTHHIYHPLFGQLQEKQVHRSPSKRHHNRSPGHVDVDRYRDRPSLSETPLGEDSCATQCVGTGFLESMSNTPIIGALIQLLAADADDSAEHGEQERTEAEVVGESTAPSSHLSTGGGGASFKVDWEATRVIIETPHRIRRPSNADLDWTTKAQFETPQASLNSPFGSGWEGIMTSVSPMVETPRQLILPSDIRQGRK